ncbi:hypothetical protein EMMF5_002641 [Cystobasidiomycetes sp. EMM_F5]
MLGYTSCPSHFQQHFARPAYAYSHHPHPHQSCSHQARYTPYSYSDEVDDESSYYAYLDHLRARQEQRELEDAIAQRRAREQAFFAAQQAEVRARVRARAYEEAQQAAYRRKILLQRQAEQQAVAIARARAAEAEHQRRVEAAQRRRDQEAQTQAFVHAILRAIASQAAAEHISMSKLPTASPQPAIAAPRPSSVAAVQPAPKPVVAAQVKPSSHPKIFLEKAFYFVQSDTDQDQSTKEHLSAISKLKQRFDESRKAFVQPEALTFDQAKSTPQSPVLAFTPENKAYRLYEEALTRLLVDLDQIATEGSADVRAQRKALAVAIEEELTRLDNMKAQAWEKEQKHGDAESVGQDSVAETVVAASNTTKDAIEQDSTATEAVAEPNASGVSEAHPTETTIASDNINIADEAKESEEAIPHTNIQETSTPHTSEARDFANNARASEAEVGPASLVNSDNSNDDPAGYLVDQLAFKQTVREKMEEPATAKSALTPILPSLPAADNEAAASSAESPLSVSDSQGSQSPQNHSISADSVPTIQSKRPDQTGVVDIVHTIANPSFDAVQAGPIQSPALSSVDKSTKVSDEEDDGEDESSDSSFEMLDL